MESPAIAASYYHNDEEELRRLQGGSEMNTWEW
jgi:hypothetical protein